MFGIPQRFIILGATHALVLAIGLAYGNHWATRAALQTAYDNSAREMAAATGALINHNKAEKVADDKAHRTLRARTSAAQTARLDAVSALAQEREINVGLQKRIDSMVACDFSGELRRALDAASGAAPDRQDGPSGMAADAASAGTATPDRLTCDQLVRGYIALGADRQELAAKYETLRERLAQ